MSRNSRLSGSAAIVSAAMVFCVADTGFAQTSDRLFKHDYSFSIPAAANGPASASDVVVFDDGGHSMFLPGDAQIGGDGGPQARTPGAAAASFGSAAALTVESNEPD